MTVLLFGVGTDYALIIFSRLRDAMAQNSDPRVAVAHAMRSVAGALAASVSTIVAAVLAMLAAVTPTLRDFGPYLALGVGSMAAVASPSPRRCWSSVVASPSGPGRHLQRTAICATTGSGPGSPTWWMAAPRRVLAGGLAALLVMCAGLLGIQQSFDLVSGFRIDTQSATGQKMLAESFGPGSSAPSQVLVHAGSAMTLGQVKGIAGAVESAPGVDHIGAVKPSPDRSTVSVDAVLSTNPYGPEAMDSLTDLRESAAGAARRAGVENPEVLIGGETSNAADTRRHWIGTSSSSAC